MATNQTANIAGKPTGKRKRGRPPVTKDRHRIQTSISQETFVEAWRWYADGGLDATFSGTLEFMIRAFLDANRELLPMMEHASTLEKIVIRRSREARGQRVMRSRVANKIMQMKSSQFMDLQALSAAVNGPEKLGLDGLPVDDDFTDADFAKFDPDDDALWNS